MAGTTGTPAGTAARQWSLTESIRVAGADPATLYGLVAELRTMGRWSPECRAVWVRGARVRTGTRFVGFNRRGPFVWFTTGRVTEARPGEAFVFDVGVFGLPIARWGYRFEAVEAVEATGATGATGVTGAKKPEEPNGTDGAAGPGTRVTETWQDLRTGHGSGFTVLLGRIFAGSSPERRIALNRAGMRTTLARLAREAAPPA